MTPKARLSSSVDAELLDAGRRAVSSGAVENLSAWVNDALRLKAAHDARLQALAAFLNEYEAEHGQISDAEIAAATKRMRAKARPVRGRATA